MPHEYTHTSAVVSPCGAYRYSLWRQWSDERCGTFIMLNPSTADGKTDDPTIRRVVQFGKDMGWGGVLVVNLFAFRATSPAAMLAADDPVGPDNDQHIKTAMLTSPAGVVCGWGRGDGDVRVMERAFQVRLMAKRLGVQLTALRFTANGTPGHPLYIPASARPVLYAHPGD